jgi:transposase InsO family protein
LLRYVARKRRDEAILIRRIHELAIRQGRYGCRRVAVLLGREGWKVNKKRVHRIWKSEGLGLPRRRPKRRRMGPPGEIVNKAEYPNHVWSYDFLEDRTERGGKLRILAIIDEFTRECLAIRIASSIPASVVAGVLEWLFLTQGVPRYLRSDNGPEFIARAVCQWLESAGCQTLFINPGSPWENGYIESFIDKLRDECLNREVFHNGKEARAIVENWRQEYNNYRPHSSLDYLTPAEFVGQYYEKNQAEGIRQLTEMAGTLSL